MSAKNVFVEKFKLARKESGLSQRELAERLGVSRTIVSDWEQGRSSPSMDRLDDISNSLKKPIAYFFSARDNTAQFGISDEEFLKNLDDLFYSFLDYKD